MAVGLATLLVFALTVFFAEVMRTHVRATHGGGKADPAAMGAREQGFVYQRPFPDELRASRRRAEEQDRLHSYGWSDRSRGLAHEPIEQAEARLRAAQGGTR